MLQKSESASAVLFPADSAWRSTAQLLRHHAARDAARAAIVDVDREVSISFGDLEQSVRTVSAQLTDSGIRRGERVVLVTDGGIETIVVWLALWRISAVVCPFEISQIGALSTQAAFQMLCPVAILHGQRIDASDLPSGLTRRIRFSQWPVVAGEVSDISLEPRTTGQIFDDHADHDRASLDAIAAMCCTSGSTGRVKIVVQDHRSYWLNGLASIELLDLRESDHFLEYRAMSWYSPQILSLMPLLQIGLTLHMAKQFSASKLPYWISKNQITVIAAVPTVLNILLKHPLARLRRRASTVRLMTSSSAPLSAHTWLNFERETGIRILNLYGSSECGWVCGNSSSIRRIGTAGRAAPGMDVRLVDENGQLCLLGEPGEVVARGDKLAVGLLQADGSIHPIRGQAFLTRDLAVMDAEGYVRLLGRLDDLIIRGGVKISTQEIEEALLGHPSVVEVGAVGVPDEIYGQAAACFVVLRPDRVVGMAELLKFAAGQLPREKRPDAVFAVDILPRNARGKLRRDALKTYWQSMLSTGDSGQEQTG